MNEEELKEACKRLDKAGIPYTVEREICLERPSDEAKARALLQGLSLDEASKAQEKELDEFLRAVVPLVKYMQKRKSQTHGLDGATVIATYEGVRLLLDKVGVPIQECIHGQNSDTSSSSLPDTVTGQEKKEEHCEQIQVHQKETQSGGGREESPADDHLHIRKQ